MILISFSLLLRSQAGRHFRMCCLQVSTEFRVPSQLHHSHAYKDTSRAKNKIISSYLNFN